MKKFCFNVFMILSIAANAAGFVVALDGQLDFLTWNGLNGWSMFGNTALVLITYIPFVYAAGWAVKRIKERRCKRYLTKRVMYLL